MNTLKTAAVFLFTVFIIAGCGGGKEIQSTRMQNTEDLSSRTDDRLPELSSTGEKSAIYFASQNNDDFLDLYIVTNNNVDMLKILRMGLSVSIKPAEGKEFTIQYPVHSQPGGMQDRFQRDNSGRENIQEREEAFIHEMIQRQIEFNVLDDKKNNISTRSAVAGGGITPLLTFSSGRLSYQLRLPLNKKIDPILSSILRAGDKIDVVIATNEFRRPEESEGRGRGMNGEAGGGGMRGGRHPGGGMGNPNFSPENMRQRFEPVKIELILKLAPGNK